MAALDWQTPRNALVALPLTDANDTNRDVKVRELEQYGPMQDSAYLHFGASAVDASKAAGDAAFAAATASWQTSTQSIHEAADQMVRYLIGGPSVAFWPDGSGQGPLTARMEEAERAIAPATHPKHSLADELRTHQVTVGSSYAGRPMTPSYSGAYVERSPILGGVVGTNKSYNLHEFERDVLGPAIADANLLLAELSFV
jgi:hypothetical protein